MARAARNSPWPTAQQRERERGEKRDAVLKAAVRCFNERGFHATSLDDVAASLNVTKPTIYYYFTTKDEVLFECVQRGLDSIRSAAEAIDRAGGTAMERLKALMRDYAIIMTKDFGMCVIRTADHELSPDSRKKFRGLKREIDQTVRRVVEEGMADGSIASGDARMMTFAVTGALNWIARWYDENGSVPAESVADTILNVLVNGLAPRTSKGAARR